MVDGGDRERTQLATDPRPPTPAGRTAASGTLLGARYQLGERLGEGATSSVFHAYDRELREDIALKLLAPSPLYDPRQRERLRVEVRLARRIAHPNVCRVYDVGEADGFSFLTME